MVEIFCGILSGSAWGPSVRKWKIQDQVFQNVHQRRYPHSFSLHLHLQNCNNRCELLFCAIKSCAINMIYNNSKFDCQVANLGQCFVALDPSAFTDSFPERLQVCHHGTVANTINWLFPGCTDLLAFGYFSTILNSFHPSSQSLLEMCRGLPPLDPELPVLVPGDRFW